MLSAPGAFFFLSCFSTFSILSSLTILLRSIFSACIGLITDDLSGPRSPSASRFSDSSQSISRPILARVQKKKKKKKKKVATPIY